MNIFFRLRPRCHRKRGRKREIAVRRPNSGDIAECIEIIDEHTTSRSYVTTTVIVMPLSENGKDVTMLIGGFDTADAPRQLELQ